LKQEPFPYPRRTERLWSSTFGLLEGKWGRTDCSLERNTHTFRLAKVEVDLYRH